MEKFKKYFAGVNTKYGCKYEIAYEHFKPYMIQRTIQIKQSVTKRGRPVEMNYDKFFDALFFVVNEGCRYHVSKFFGIPKSTFTRHFKFLTDNNILEVIFDELTEDLVLPKTNLILTDTMSVPSKDGSEGLGYSYKYKGK